ncbi:MAG: DMT family transporter [Mycobacteriales bacterium]
MPTTARVRRRTSSSTLAAVGLLGVTAAWGSTFFLIKDVVERVPVSDFLAARFALATLAVWLLAPRSVARLTPVQRRSGVLLGLVYGLAQLLQTVGLQTTAASVSGFVTGMYVVFTPLLGAVLLRARIGRIVWVAVALATAGLAALSLQGLAIGSGEALTLASAVLYAAHIVGLGVWSTGNNALGLTVVQLLTITAVCGVTAAPGGIVLPQTGADWSALVFMALLAGALALVVQTWAQAHLAATRAAIIMTMEPVWAALFAVLFGGERLGPRVVVGGALVLGAMYLVELGPRRPGDQDVAEEVGGVTHVGPV